MMSTRSVAVGGYMWRFAAFCASFTAALMALAISGYPVPGSNIVPAMVSAVVVGDRFVKDHGRVPNLWERRRLSVYSLLVSIVISLSLASLLIIATAPAGDWQWVFGQLLSEFAQQIGQAPMVWAGITIVVLAIYYSTFAIIYGWVLRKRTARRMPKAAAADANPK